MGNKAIDPDDILWRERKRIWCGLPWTFTVYTVTDDALIVQTGFLNQKYDTIKLFRVTDLTVTRSLIQRIFGLGSIIVDGFDRSTDGQLIIRNIPNVFDAKKLLDKAVDYSRGSNRVVSREYMTDDGDNAW